jgi:hypothetical protein
MPNNGTLQRPYKNTSRLSIAGTDTSQVEPGSEGIEASSFRRCDNPFQRGRRGVGER